MARWILRPVLATALGIAVLAAWAPADAASGSSRRAPAPRREPTLAERLQALARRPPVRRSEFSVAAAKVGDPDPILAVNADAPLTLASTTKVFTTAAALDRLGAGYRFRTTVVADGPVAPDGTLDGPLV